MKCDFCGCESTADNWVGGFIGGKKKCENCYLPNRQIKIRVKKVFSCNIVGVVTCRYSCSTPNQSNVCKTVKSN